MSKIIKYFLGSIIFVCLSINAFAEATYAYLLKYSQDNNSKVVTYRMNEDHFSKGDLTQIAAIQTGNIPTQITLDATKQFVYVVSNKENSIYGYRINKITGELSQIEKPVSTGKKPQQITFVETSDNNQFAYVTNNGDATISAFVVEKSGKLTSIGTFKTCEQPAALTADPSGKYLYVSTWDTKSNQLVNYSINPKSGKLTNITPNPATNLGYIPLQLKFDPSGTFVYKVNAAITPSISNYSFNEDSGNLNSVTSISAKAPVAINFNRGYAYVVDRDSNMVVVYLMDPQSGALNKIAEISTSGVSPSAIAFDQTGQFAYVTNSASKTIAMFKVNQDTGILEPFYYPTLSTGENAYPRDIVLNTIY